MDGEDIIMTDLSRDLGNTDDISLSDDDIRSPRTPTWAPDSPSSLVSPFDYAKFFGGSLATTPPSSIPLAPEKPLPWVWQCHLCRHRYPIGVTRRCLYDGHYYCSGETDRPNLKKKRKGQACSSEFDYEGWAAYGDWKRSILAVMKNPRIPKACEKCDFPSECRTPETQKPIRKRKTAPPATIVALSDLRKDLNPPTSILSEVRIVATVEGSKDTEEKVEIGQAVKVDIAKFRQSKVQELVKIMHEGHRKNEKSDKRKSGKKAVGLGIIAEEESTKTTVAQDISNLLMPMVDIWSSKSSKS